MSFFQLSLLDRIEMYVWYEKNTQKVAYNMMHVRLIDLFIYADLCSV